MMIWRNIRPETVDWAARKLQDSIRPASYGAGGTPRQRDGGSAIESARPEHPAGPDSGPAPRR